MFNSAKTAKIIGTQKVHTPAKADMHKLLIQAKA